MTEIEIRLAGIGGQGLILGTRMLADALAYEGKQVAQSQSYEPTSRGGLSRSDLVVSDSLVDYPLATSLDYLLLLHTLAFQPSVSAMKADGMIIIDRDVQVEGETGDFTVYSLALIEAAKEIGNVRASNIVALGALVGLSEICRADSLEWGVRGHSPGRFLEYNLAAMKAGLSLAEDSIGRQAAG